MTLLATSLITNSFFVSGIRSRDFQTVSGPDLSYGLQLLNEILGDKSIEQDMIPYLTVPYSLNCVEGQEAYFIPNLIQLSTITFFIGEIRYSMSNNSRDLYFGASRANNINSLPVTFHVERCLNGSKIYLYFFPNTTYPLEITGLFALQPVTATQDLSLIFEPFYTNYLKYALAVRLCADYNYQVPDIAMKYLTKAELEIQSQSTPMDLKTKIITTFDNNNSVNYAQANLGQGWTTGSVAWG